MRLSSRRFSRRSVLAAALLSIPACSLPGSPAPSAPVVPTTSPQATPSVAPTSATAVATAAPGPENKVEAVALWTRKEDNGYLGGFSTVGVTAQRMGGSELRVGFYEQEVGESGPMWRAAGWMAVSMSGLLLGIDPTEYRYSYDLGGYVDGPSAGGLLTVATLAALLGHSMRPEAALAAAINPDGTLGPVAGLPHKIDGAADAGKKLVLIALGQREARDENDQARVDVVERGARQGVEVREVGNIYDAYEAATGKPLPRPAGARSVAPSLTPAAAERVRAKTQEWLGRHGKLKEKYEALPDNLRPDFSKRLVDEAGQAADKAAAHLQQGQPAAAYSKATQAAIAASIAVNFPRVFEGLLTGGMNGANKHLRPLKPDLKIDALLEQLGTRQAGTLSEAVALADAYGNLGLAIGMVDLGDAVLRRDKYEPRVLLTRVAVATSTYVVADQAVELARDSVDLGLGVGGAPAAAPEKLENMAELFRRAAEANLNYFDAVVLTPLAEEEGVHLDVVRSSFSDPSYQWAYASLLSTAALKKRTRGYVPAAYAMLGSSLNSYVLSSSLLARRTALGVDVDENGVITGIQNEAALTAMLDFAERRAQEISGLAQSAGGEAVQPALNYASGHANRGGSVDEKLEALQGYWTAALQGQIIGMLSGAARVSP